MFGNKSINKIILIILVLLLIIFVLYACIVKPKRIQKTGYLTDKQLQFLDGDFANISPNAINYGLVNFAYLFDKNNDTRLVVIYPTVRECPEAAKFIAAVKKESERREFKDEYKFVQVDTPQSKNWLIVTPQEKQNIIKGRSSAPEGTYPVTDSEYKEQKTFLLVCSKFCVINPYTGKVYSYKNIDNKKAKKVHKTLEYLINL